MSTMNVHDRTQERNQLQRCEQSRYDSQHRRLFWENGTRWEYSLECLIQRENVSDSEYRRQIDDAILGSNQQIALEEQFFLTLENDIDWYQRFATNLQNTYEQLPPPQKARSKAVAELKHHLIQIELQLLARWICYRQFELEILERRRNRDGDLDREEWATCWRALEKIVASQQMIYKNVYQSSLPAHICEKHLAWCRRLRKMQEQTLENWQDRRKVNRRALYRDARQVKASIARLSYRPILKRSSTQLLIGIVICAIVFGLVLAILLNHASHAAFISSSTIFSFHPNIIRTTSYIVILLNQHSKLNTRT